MVAAARELGLPTVIVTGDFQRLPADVVQTLAIEPGPPGWWQRPGRPSGGGDLFTAILAAALVEGLPTAAAVASRRRLSRHARVQRRGAGSAAFP
jgi:pyridoxal/pyridoxine/pyridoxamine kinase